MPKGDIHDKHTICRVVEPICLMAPIIAEKSKTE